MKATTYRTKSSGYDKYDGSFECELSVGDAVCVIHEFGSAMRKQYANDRSILIEELPTHKEHLKFLSGPSYSAGNRTTYYVGCGVVTKIFKNGNVTVSQKFSVAK